VMGHLNVNLLIWTHYVWETSTNRTPQPPSKIDWATYSNHR